MGAGWNKGTIEAAESRHPDLVRGQTWFGTQSRYKYLCEEHGEYLQIFSNHDRGSRCVRCGLGRVWKRNQTADGLSKTPEYRTVADHFQNIFNPNRRQHANYKGMPFFDSWNPNKGGSLLKAAKWIVGNLGERPENASLHIVTHERGFVPGNLEWAFRQKQNAEQLFKIVADLRHRNKELEGELQQLKERYQI